MRKQISIRYEIKDSINHRYIVQNPSQKTGNGKHTRFRILKSTFDENWKTTSSQTIKNEQITAINNLYTAKQLDFETARKSIDDIVINLYKIDKSLKAILNSPDNQKALEIYLERKYPPSKRNKLADFASAQQESTRAIESLGQTSILSAPIEDIQEAIDLAAKNSPNKQRRLAAKINAVLRIVRPDADRLSLDGEDHNGLVKHLTHTEFLKLLPYLETKLLKVAAQVCFYTGCRIGEACALEPSDFREKQQTILINKQIPLKTHDKWLVKRKTKNKKIRQTVIFPEGIEPLKEWFKIKKTLTKDERRYLSRILRKACHKAFIGNEEKHLKWHDLRHSYAIRLLDKGLGIDDVADMIGDSVIVAKKHYVGFIISDARMERIRTKVLDLEN